MPLPFLADTSWAGSLSLGNLTGEGSGIHTGAVGTEEELAVALDDGIQEGASILGALGGGLAVVVLLGGLVNWYATRGRETVWVRGALTTLADQSSTRRER